MALLLALRTSWLLLSTVTFTCGQTGHSNQVISFTRSFPHPDSLVVPRAQRTTGRRNAFFPPPDRLSPTLRPIIHHSGSSLSSKLITTTSRPALDKEKDYDYDYYEYFDYSGNDTEYYEDSKGVSKNTPSTAPRSPSTASLLSASGFRFTTSPRVDETTRNPSVYRDTTSNQLFREDIRRPSDPSGIPSSEQRFRFASVGDRATRPPIIQTTASGARKSLLADLIAQLNNNGFNGLSPSSNDLESDRERRVLNKSQSNISGQRSPKDFKVRVTNSTESTFAVGSVASSQSIKMKDKSPNSSSFSYPSTTLNTYSYNSEQLDTTYLNEPEATTGSAFMKAEGKAITEDDSSARNPPARIPAKDRPLSSLFENIQIAVDPALLPPGYSVENITEEIPEKGTQFDISLLTSKTNTSPEDTFSKSTLENLFSSLPQEDITSLLPADFVASSTVSSFPKVSSQEASNVSKEVKPVSEVKSVDHNVFLPPDIRFAETLKNETVKRVVTQIASPPVLPAENAGVEDKIPGVSVANVDVLAFLPPGFKLEKNGDIPGIQIKNVDTSAFLPPGFNAKAGKSTVATTSEEPTTKKVGSSGIVFPRRPNRPAFLTTTSSLPTLSGPPPIKPKIQNLFDRIKALATTEYVVPVVTEANPSAKQQSDIKVTSTATTTTTTSTTTSSTTTTTALPRLTTPGICGNKCRLAASLRLISGTKWKPELANRDTLEFQQLANEIEAELDSFFRSSSLSLWYDYVEIDSFNKGSVIVSYFLSLSKIDADIDTSDLKEQLNVDLERVAHSLGNFTIDPKGTDFIVMAEEQNQEHEDKDNFLIPEWLIAVIVIGLASVLFILIFGVVALVSRARVKKRTNVPLTEEFLNNLNALQVNGIDNYAMNGLYDMETMWNDKYPEKSVKPPSSKDKGYNPEFDVNIYDSWRTDYSGPYTSSTGNFSKRRPELDFDGGQFYKDDPYDF